MDDPNLIIIFGVTIALSIILCVKGISKNVEIPVDYKIPKTYILKDSLGNVKGTIEEDANVQKNR